MLLNNLRKGTFYATINMRFKYISEDTTKRHIPYCHDNEFTMITNFKTGQV